MNITAIGIDLAKTVFHIHAVDQRGNKVFSKKLKREQLAEFINQQPPCLIGMEACSGAHYWATKFKSFGHDVRLIAPQFVKPYVQGNKNDWNDARAIAEAVTRPHMRFVPIKDVEQLAMQSMHRVRSQLVKQRTALANEIRGLLSEYGIVIQEGIAKLRAELPFIIEDASNALMSTIRTLCDDMREHLKELDRKISHYDQQIKVTAKSSKTCQKLMAIEGIGPQTATIIAATVTDTKLFKNGRELAAWMGLVPSQHSSGGKNVLLGISKRGDRYIRCLLIHGARSALRSWKNKPRNTPRVIWALRKIEELGFNKACVALANKMARTIWAVLDKDVPYQSDYQPQLTRG